MLELSNGLVVGFTQMNEKPRSINHVLLWNQTGEMISKYETTETIVCVRELNDGNLAFVSNFYFWNVFRLTRSEETLKQRCCLFLTERIENTKQLDNLEKDLPFELVDLCRSYHKHIRDKKLEVIRTKTPQKEEEEEEKEETIVDTALRLWSTFFE